VAERPQLGTRERPLRVVVVGSSAVFMVQPPPTSSDEAPYGRLLPEYLLARGIVADVTVHSQWHATIREVLPKFEPWVRDHFPDIVVVNLGMAESQARVLPTWLVRNVMTWHVGMSSPAHLYRRAVVPRLRRLVRNVQRQLVGHVGLWASRVPPKRFVRSMSRLVTMSTKGLGAQVLLLDIDPPGERVVHWLPGLTERVTVYNELLEQVASGVPEARVLRTSSVIEPREVQQLLPDGLHRSAEGHRRVAALIADEITQVWRERMATGAGGP
jgi:NAD(P)-dependent dehydrogenase (short-subunit alcohol dehydrogenase family)